MLLQINAAVIEKFSEHPVLLLIIIILSLKSFKAVDERVSKWFFNKIPRRKNSSVNRSRIYSLLKDFIIEYAVDRVYIIIYTEDLKQFSLDYEVPNHLPSIGFDYQNKTTKGFYKKLTDLLLLNDKLIYHKVDDIKDPEKEYQLSLHKIKSWYCFGLKGPKHKLKASLNICFIEENGLSAAQIAGLNAKIEHLERILL